MISKYLTVLEATRAAHVIRPYSAGGTAEIVAAPKVYGFDTGFVCYHRGWSELRREDLGLLFEHYVLNQLHAQLRSRDVRYWPSKHGSEVDFVLAGRSGAPTGHAPPAPPPGGGWNPLLRPIVHIPDRWLDGLDDVLASARKPGSRARAEVVWARR